MVVARITVGEAKRIWRVAFIRVGIDLVSGATGIGDAAGCEVVVAAEHIFRVEPLITGILATVLDAGIIRPQATPVDRRGGSAEEELMRGNAWPLVGLEHPVGEAVLVGDLEIRVEDVVAVDRVPLGVLDIGHGRTVLTYSLVGAEGRGRAAGRRLIIDAVRVNLAGSVHVAVVPQLDPAPLIARCGWQRVVVIRVPAGC